MATLDVSDILRDPELTSVFTLTRRKQVLVNGVVQVQAEDIEENPDGSLICGTITSASPQDLDRLDDQERMGRNLSVVTTFRLRGPAKVDSVQYLPDLVHWQGSDYVVKWVDPYANYGAGFIQAIIGSQEIIDPPVPEAGT